MTLSDPLPPNAITVRVGCALAYETARPTPVLLLIRPRAGETVMLLEERLVCETGSPAEQFVDHHGNLMLRTVLQPGRNEFIHDAILSVPGLPDDAPLFAHVDATDALPWEVLRYTFPSRYCESDKLGQFAQQTFGGIPPGAGLAQAICDWTHHHIEYRYGSGSPFLSAADVLDRRYGVCRDFAHVMVALCRALDLPARYAAGYMPYRGIAEHDIGIDFHAWCEVYAGGRWHVYDPRHNKPHPGRIKTAHGMDAVDAAFATFYGHAEVLAFQVWAYEIDAALERVGDPVTVVKGSNGTAEVVTGLGLAEEGVRSANGGANSGANDGASGIRPALPPSLPSPSSSPSPLHG